MNFTREPIIETIVTPRDGCKLAIRNSKGAGKDEYLLDAVELVSFGSNYFYRSIDRAKNFLLPVNDYELVEIKEARITLKHVVSEKNVKIGGGRDAVFKVGKETPEEEAKPSKTPKPSKEESKEESKDESKEEESAEKKKDARRRPKRRRTSRTVKEEETKEETTESEEPKEVSKPEEVKQPTLTEEEKLEQERENKEKQALRSMLLVPPDALISERLTMMRADEENEGGDSTPTPPPPPPLDDVSDLPQDSNDDKPEEDNS